MLINNNYALRNADLDPSSLPSSIGKKFKLQTCG